MYVPKTHAQQKRRSLELVGKSWSWLFLLVLVIFFSISGQGFLSFANLQNIVTDMAFALLVALGQTFVVISGGFDLSTGYVMGLSSIVSALVVVAVSDRMPLPLVVLLGLLAGVIVGIIPGFLNGVIIARLSVPPFIVTLGMYGIARGAGFILSHGQPVNVLVNGIGAFGNGFLLYILPGYSVSFLQPPPGFTNAQLRSVTQVLPFQLIISIVLVVICHWLLSQTRFGSHIYAIGGNREAALRAGIPVLLRTIQVYILSAFLAATAGVLYMLRFTNGAADAGDPLLLDSIAAVAIGGASLFGGEGTIVGTVIGTLIIAVIQNGLVILGVDPFWQFITIGIVIILAVLVYQSKGRLRFFLKGSSS